VVAQSDVSSSVPSADDSSLGFGADAVRAGEWNLASWSVYTGAGGATGPTGQSQALSLLIEGTSVEEVSGDGGAGVATQSIQATQCDGVILSNLTCGGTGTTYLEVLSASSTSLALYDGMEELDFASGAASPDAGVLDLGGAACATDPVVCGGLPNVYYNASPPTEASSDGGAMPAEGTGTAVPDGDIYAAVGVTLFNQTTPSSHTQRFNVELVPGIGPDGGAALSGTFRMAYARDQAFSTRLNGTYAVDPSAHTFTFDSVCPSSQATVAYDGTDGCNFTLYVPASFLDISGSNEAIQVECD
jgi:hypothetical protein